jgi:hypothetical protein
MIAWLLMRTLLRTQWARRSDLNYRPFQEGKQKAVLAKGKTGAISKTGRAKGV